MNGENERSSVVVEYRVTQLERGQREMRAAQEKDKNEIIDIIKEHNSEAIRRLDQLKEETAEKLDVLTGRGGKWMASASSMIAAIASVIAVMVAVFRHP